MTLTPCELSHEQRRNKIDLLKRLLKRLQRKLRDLEGHQARKGRPPSKEIDSAMRMKAEGHSNREIYVALGKTTSAEQRTLREAMRQRKNRQRRHKQPTAGASIKHEPTATGSTKSELMEPWKSIVKLLGARHHEVAVSQLKVRRRQPQRRQQKTARRIVTPTKEPDICTV
jgi:hypothetical protein